MSAVSLSETLMKQGHWLRNWKARFFKLEGVLLKYYETDGSGSSSNADDLKGVIALQNCTVEAAEPAVADGRPFCFRIQPMSGKVFLVQGNDEASRDRWIAAIRTSSQLAKPCHRRTHSEDLEGTSAKNMVASEREADANVALGDFELLKVIGRGSYGKVMQVKRRDTGDVYAMKVLKKESVFARNNPKDLQHTITERSVLALVNKYSHPFILGLQFAFHTPAKLYYVLDFCNGGDLYYLLSRCKRFREHHARFYAAETLTALQHLHSIGVLYRDLKPENVLIHGDGHVKLADFGLCKESSTADTFCGTPVYLAPEIWLRRTYGYEVDWWSLGCILFEMVVGLPPFWGDNLRDVRAKVFKPPSFPAGMTTECQGVIAGMLDLEPEKRLGSAGNGADIRTHPFFAPIDWTQLLAKQITPPYQSSSSADSDLRNFHKAFTNEEAIDSTNTLPPLLTAEQQAAFDGFTYDPTAVAEASAPTGDGQGTIDQSINQSINAMSIG